MLIRSFFTVLAACCLVSEARYQELNVTEVALFETIKNHPSQRRTTMQLDPRLCAIARQHCQDMNDQGFFAHQNPKTEKNANDRLKNIGYPAPSYYGAGDNFIESLALDAPTNASIAATSWFHSGAHKTHVYGQKNPDGSEFFVNQILIGVAYVTKTDGNQGYYAFISSHPPEGQSWKLNEDFEGPGLKKSGDSLVLTAIPAHAVFTVEESTGSSLQEWTVIGCCHADPIIPPSLHFDPLMPRYYRIRWTDY